MASIFAPSRPSEKLGTHSTSCRGILLSSRLIHRPLNSMLFRKAHSLAVSGIRMADHPHPRIGRKYALQASFAFVAAIGYHNHPRMLRITDAYATTIMNRNPGSTRGRVHQSVQERPIGDRVRTIEHGFSFPKGRG